MVSKFVHKSCLRDTGSLTRWLSPSLRESSRRSLTREEGESHHDEDLLFHLQGHEEKERPPNTFEKTLRFVLLVMFVLYPKVTNVAFEGFSCCASGGGSNARRAPLLCTL
jgi:hypothetical protein